MIVNPDLSVPSHPEIFVLGDAASFTPEGQERALPGVAQVAIQMGRYASRVIREEIKSGSSTTRRRPFKYFDKGSMAIIGKNKAVASVGRFKMAGMFAWMLWAVVHIAFIVGFRNRFRVLLNWAWSWILDTHDARLITGDSRLGVRRPQGAGFEPIGSRDEV